jgi:hypothetical protein
MASLKENAITKIATATGIDVKTAASVALLVVPVGKSLIVDNIVIRGNSASLAGGTSYGFTGWRTGIDLSGLTATTGFRKLFAADNATYTPVAAGATFYLIVTTGATAAGTATFDIFGHLV